MESPFLALIGNVIGDRHDMRRADRERAITLLPLKIILLMHAR